MSAPNEFLELLLAVAETSSLAEAGLRLGLTQPAVSLKLKRLERQIPLPVTRTEGRRKTLTRFGRDLHQLARAHDSRLARGYESLLRRYVDGSELALRLGARPELLELVLPRLRFPGTIELFTRSGRDATRGVLDHSLDLAISAERPDSSSLSAKRLFTSRAMLVVSRRLGGRRRTSRAQSKPLWRDPEFLAKTPAVAYESDGHLLKDLLKHHGLGIGLGTGPREVRLTHVVQDWRMLARLAAGGAGYAIVPDYVRVESNAAGAHDLLCETLPASVSPPVDFYLLYEPSLRAIAPYRAAIDSLRSGTPPARAR